MYKLNQINESQEDDTPFMYQEWGFMWNAVFSLEHIHILCWGGEDAFVGNSAVKMRINQGSNGDSKELLWDPLRRRIETSVN